MNRKKNPANIYFYIPKIETPKGARDTDTVNKEQNIQVYEEGVSQMATEKYIYIYNTVSNRWKGCETSGVYTNLAA